MANSSNIKSAVDDFWLEMSGNSERAKELVRKYYSRVVGANKLFTSFKEGWKTDRGMILIIYGAPNLVYKTSNSESWIYGDGSSLLSMTFNFIKVINPFTDNDFELTRSPIYQNTWYSSVDSWRHGRAFNEY
jgi:GWxTD domain-containing protein